ncbi:MAG: hypothetical protein HYS05_15855 [Acidobacteria bacterium]|nr:hypothetical protein [Acidobacteriota bacterium]
MTGRLPSRTSLGLLAALTGEESARVLGLDGASGITTVRVAPRTAYALARVQQEFGNLASTASGLVTMVHRGLRRSDPLAALLTRNAFTAGGDMTLRFKGGEYEF